ncbi:MAG TPA: glycosyltransferase family 4 protein [Nocardioides sp.]|uniref:glycosyltransferase family 4 protein n=1 Tax=Nocardioides sp. TaxID=35761 RepID=UPI002F414061
MPVETTFLGPVMDQRAAVARAYLRPRGENASYDLVRDHFDVIHYLLQSPVVAEIPSVDLVQHFLDEGVALLKSPSPDFSMEAYLERYPELLQSTENPYVDWLRRGRAAGVLADPAAGITELAPLLGLEPDEVLRRVHERRSDVLQRLRTGGLGEMFAKAAEIEPLIGEAWVETTRPRMLPFSHLLVVQEVSAIHSAQEAAEFRPARLVFVVNKGRWGGGRRMEGHLAHALAHHIDPDEIVVIYTDESSEAPAGRYPAGVREVDFAQISSALRPEEAQHALVMLVRTFRADAIVNINSRMMYHALRAYGAALATSERVFHVYFCHEQVATGWWRGWSLRYFYRTYDTAAGIITDSEHLARELSARHRAMAGQQERIHVFRAPVDASIPVADTPPSDPARRPQVFWAGRWDRQKRLEVFFEIARQMPDVDFRMWGEAVLGSERGLLPENVKPMGRYDHFSELPLAEADLWLYTSAWDGVPSLLLEVTMTGVPVVGTRVGGTEEVLVDDEAWPIELEEGPEAYVDAIRSVLSDPSAARKRALALRERLLRERTPEAFEATALEVLLPELSEGEPR